MGQKRSQRSFLTKAHNGRWSLITALLQHSLLHGEFVTHCFPARLGQGFRHADKASGLWRSPHWKGWFSSEWIVRKKELGPCPALTSHLPTGSPPHTLPLPWGHLPWASDRRPDTEGHKWNRWQDSQLTNCELSKLPYKVPVNREQTNTLPCFKILKRIWAALPSEWIKKGQIKRKSVWNSVKSNIQVYQQQDGHHSPEIQCKFSWELSSSQCKESSKLAAGCP